MPSKFLMITWTCLDLLGLSFSSPTSMKRFDLELSPPASWTSIVKSNLSNCSRSILVLVKRIPDSSSRLNKGVPVKSLNLNGSALGGRSGSDAVSWVTRLKWKNNNQWWFHDVHISKLRFELWYHNNRLVSKKFAYGLGNPGRFLGSTWDIQLKFSYFAWFRISWNLSKFELIQTTFISIISNGGPFEKER